MKTPQSPEYIKATYKRKDVPVLLTEHQTMEAYWESGGIAPMHSLTSTTDGGEWSVSRSGRFTSR